jgi:hypothetical protein
VNVTFARPSSRQDALGAQLARDVGLDDLSQILAQTFELPHPLTVRVVNGLGGGPFYDPRSNSITFQYGFAALIFDTLQQQNPQWSPHELGFAIGSVEAFILEHEFGHALIANFDLPVLGKEEDAADTIATVLLLKSNQGARLAGNAAEFWAEFSGRQSPPAIADYADAHSLDLQRAFDIMCNVAGSGRDAFREVQALGVLPNSRLAGCPQEYQQAVDSLEQTLQPHLRGSIDLQAPGG